ncbi:unnamed protein product [Alopecurus aequalis]
MHFCFVSGHRPDPFLVPIELSIVGFKLYHAMHGGSRVLAAVLVLFLVAALNPPPVNAIGPWPFCGSSGQYTAGSAYEANLQRLTQTLATNTSASPALFATATAGAGTNQTVYAVALCQGDMPPSACFSCLDSVIRDGQLACPFDMDMAMYKEICHVRFSNHDFLAASTTNSPQHVFFSDAPNLSSSTAANRFNSVVAELLNATAEHAVNISSTRFATGEMVVDPDYSDGQFANAFSTAQCTPDLTQAQCRACLVAAMAEMPQRVFPTNTPGAIVVGERCGLRFDTYSFFNGDAMVLLHVGGPEEIGTKKIHVLVIVLAMLGGLLVMVLIGFLIWRKKRSPRKAALFEDMETFESIFMGLSTLRSATSNFDEMNKLGEGGFGAVYKGALPDGQEVAVKRLTERSKQGLVQMKNELALIAKLQHKNLVRLIGVCLEEGEHLLVYEYMSNKSLDIILFDPERSKQLDWGARYQILNGIARGMQYLHEHSQPTIVHRDLKASNILLDADMKPKISDFGLAKIFTDDQTRNATCSIIGTIGYMSPEYAMRGHYSTKLDVFSFGVLVLEIVTGRRNNYTANSDHFQDLFGLAWKHWVDGTIAEIVDPGLGRHYPRGEALKCINIGLLCIQQNPTDRPSMSSIVVMLGSDTVSVEAPYRPAYVFDRSSSYSETPELVKENTSSQPHSSITEFEAR